MSYRFWVPDREVMWVVVCGPRAAGWAGRSPSRRRPVFHPIPAIRRSSGRDADAARQDAFWQEESREESNWFQIHGYSKGNWSNENCTRPAHVFKWARQDSTTPNAEPKTGNIKLFYIFFDVSTGEYHTVYIAYFIGGRCRYDRYDSIGPDSIRSKKLCRTIADSSFCSKKWFMGLQVASPRALIMILYRINRTFARIMNYELFSGLLKH